MGMITKIQIIILVLSLLDLTASFLYVNQFHNKYPNQDPTIIEANPILKYAIRVFGINIGMLVGGLIVFGIVLLLTLNLKVNYLYYIAGLFSMMIVYHVLNFRLLNITQL